MAVKIIPIGEMRRKLKDILASLETTGEPYLITEDSSPKAVLVRYDDYNALVEGAGSAHPHIICRHDISSGEPIIRGTRIAVRHIVERVQAGESVEDILAALPHLSAAQVYDALSYYYDRKPEMDRLIEEGRLERVMAAQSLTAQKIAEGVAVVHEEKGQW